MWTETKLVIASGNAGKIAEFESIFKPWGTEVIGQKALGLESPEETGLTFIENALLKARHAANTSGYAALADDSGLVVPALNGAPGLYSARFAGPKATDADNRHALIGALESVPHAQRSGYYICALALLRSAEDPDPVVVVKRWWGNLLDTPRGSGGFGYDPLFQPKGTALTAAEMAADEKNRCSHRGLAVAALIQALEPNT